MSMGDDDTGTFASPPCFMHELDPDGNTPVDPVQARDVARWRKAERKRLVDERLAIPEAVRRERDEAIAAHLLAEIGPVEGICIGAYWPFRGEPDLRPFLFEIASRGGRCALPVVMERARPLVFRLHVPGETPARDALGIPAPADTAPEVVPDILLAPVVGFDAECYRLGYGGGFYDRTLASMNPRPRVIGVGDAQAEIPTVFPQWNDIPMTAMVTEQGVRYPRKGV
ncbi:MAG: 5-formyltetrahydrofolate cyclo-ligase [Gammaproteobacteria bacterium]|nr:5-formyltetrahydrofolate cyclo-ligase [Gammaproteobacteria bacterium]